MLNKFDFNESDKIRFLDLKNSSIKNVKQLVTLDKIKKIELKEYN